MQCIYCADRIDPLEDLFFQVGNDAIHNQCAGMVEKPVLGQCIVCGAPAQYEGIMSDEEYYFCSDCRPKNNFLLNR